MTTLPVKSYSMLCLYAGSKGVERVERLGSHAVLDVVNEVDQPRRQRRLDTGLAGQGHDDAELGVDFGTSLTHGEVAPDAAMRLGRSAVECHEVVERSFRCVARRVRYIGSRIEAVERVGRDAAAWSAGRDLTCERDIKVSVAAIGEGVGDRRVRKRG